MGSAEARQAPGRVRLTVGGTAILALLCAIGTVGAQQIVPGSNVNMVSGTSFPGGDPFLQRQNEPSSAVSTRNPLHILAGANDYRTVDLPGTQEPLKGFEANADAWLGLFKSFDGGRTWQSTLIPGFPQDVSAAGLASPIKGRQAATDPVVRAGTNGLFYYAGVAFDRGEDQPSAIFVARFVDLNNQEAGDPIAYVGTTLVDSSPGTLDLDKTAMAVDIPRTAATCTIPVAGVSMPPVPQGNVYVAYAAFSGEGSNTTSAIMVSRSTDCGVTWSVPRNVSIGSRLVQNAQIAIDPTNGAVYVSWRAFKSGTQPDAIWVVKSTNGGATFGKPVRVAPIRPFDQGTSLTSFRSNGFQTMTVDPSGRIYVAWSERGHATLRPDPITGDARIVVSTSANSLSWTTPQPIRTGGLGHELMPALTFQAGRLRMIYYDLREDVSQIFGQYVDELPILTSNDPAARRHTLDVYVAQAAPGAVPVFTSVKLSDYASGVLPGTDEIQQLQFNPPNLPLFRQGTVPFMGDYLDLAPAPMFVQDGSGQWTYNTSASGSTIAHGFWTDNRDVRAPLDGNWENYTPVTSDAVQSHSLFDPSQIVPACLPGQTGMRNQNIYTARVTEGLFVGSPGNTKPLGSIQRAFVVVVQNESAAARSYRLTIANQPLGGSASFLQFTSATSPLTVLDVSVPPFSSVARSVFATSDDEHATIRVNVNEIATPGAPTSLPGGLSGTVVLNGDATNPSLQNPSLQNPSLQNPDIAVAEVYNPDITTAFVANPSLQNPSLQNQILNPSLQNPSLQNPSLQNPSLQNDAIANPSIINPSLQNPSLQNPSLQNPSLQNPSLQNSDLVNGAIEDTTWQITNDGNTTASYSIKLVLNDTLPPGFRSQLLLHQTYTTPAADACTLALQPHTVLVANIPDPVFTPIADIANPSLQNPSLQNPTLSLAPGETAEVTLRIVDPNRFDGTTFEAQASVIPAVVAQSVNTEDAANGITQPSIALPLTITTPRLASANPGVAYQQTLQAAAANGATTWSVSNGSLPPGLTLDPATGTITGTPTTPGNYVFTVQSVDANGRTDTQSLSIQIDPTVPAGFSRVWNGVDTNWSNPANWSPNGVPTSADDVYVAAGLPVMPALTQNASVHTIVVEPGATLDTAGFTLVVGGNAFAGKTITGTGSVEIAGSDAHASGTFPNVSIGVNATVTLDGPLGVQGSLRLNAGARLVLNGQPATVAGSLLADACAARPVVSGSGATPLTAGGADVNCVDFSGAALTITGGTITRFDNTRFYGFTLNAGQSELTIVHPGTAAPMTFHGTSFLDSANPEFLVSATDSEPGGDPLAIVMADSIPADGSSKTQTGGGATVTWTSTTGAANLAIGQAVSGSRLAGSPLTYVVAVVNGGPAAASNVVVTDTLPSGATLVSALGPSGGCAVSAGAATCTIGTLPAGAAAAIQIVVTPTGAGELTNTAAVQSSGTDPNATDNTQTTRTTIFAAATAADLSITKTDSADPVAPGAAFTYTVRVHNDGPAVAPDVVVRDEAPFGITFTAAIPDAGTCTLASGVVTCALGPLAVGQDATITITAVAGTNGVHANYASVTSTAPDPNPANNVAAQFTNVTEACTVPSFSSPLAIPMVESEIFQLTAADFDGNGARDLIASGETAGSISVQLNDGLGHFSGPAFSGSATVFGFAVADFTGDGHPDIAAARTGGDLLILPGDGAGSFGIATSTTISPADTDPFNLEAADFNEDGHPDLAVEILGPDGPPLDGPMILLNDGAGNFSGGTVVPTGSPIQRLATGDFNEDGHVDLVVGHLGASQVISVLLGNGDGTFAAPVDFATNPRPRIRAVADLNEDGHLDLVVVDGITGSPNMNQLTTLFGDGHGGFGAPVVRRSDGNIHTVAVADVNGDGHVDLVSTDFVTSTFGVQFGDGAGNFSAPLGYGAPFFSGVVADDFNGDGRPDVALGDVNGIVRVFTNSCGQSPIDLAITAADAPDPVSEGDVVTYTATVRNLVDAAVSNVTVLATLPAGTFVGSSSSAGGTQSVSGAVVTWTVPSLASNATATFDYTLTTGAGGTLTFNVGVTADGADTSPGNNSATEFTTVTAGGGSLVVTNTNDSGPGSLRQAILDSNADVGDVDHVTFAIPGPGVHTITLESPLPPITAPVVIDGTTQPGFAGTPLIEVNGNGLSGAGLQVNADDSTIRGLAINRFAGNGIVLNGGGNTVEGTVIGSDPTGTFTRPNTLNGIAVSSANNRIGGTTPGAGNVIGGNALSGILVSGTGASGNTIQGNFIGSTVTEGVLDPLESADALEPDDIFVQQNGTATLSTVQNHTPRGSQSIALAPTDAGPHDIAVGGPINDTPIVGSVTIFFYDAGPGLSASLEIINSITGAVADVGTQEFDAGCYRAFVAPTPGDVRGPNASVDGCATNVATTSVARSIGWHKFSIRADGARYVLSIDDQTVFELPGTDGFDVLRVGVSGAGSGPTYFFDDLSIVAGDGAVLPNGRGIEIVDAPDTVVGGTSTAARNVISGNANEGISLSGANATGTIVQGNYIGTSAAGNDGIGNGLGVAVLARTTIGGSAAGAGNVISGNVTDGINVSGSAAANSIIQGNIIGARADLTDTIGNRARGIVITNDVSGTQIGGTDPGAGNVVAASQFADILVGGTNTTIQGNTISTDPTGTVFWSSGGGGINLSTTASNTLVGGTVPGARNLISGSSGNHLGAAIAIGGHDNRIEGNYIGTNASGEQGPGNGAAGIATNASASNNTIGGNGAGNVIAGSYLNGIALNGTNNVVGGNRIGTNASGTQAIANGWGNFNGGVAIVGGSTGNRVGGPGGNGNQIAGNAFYGVLVDGDDALVQGNVVGLNAAGTGALPNGEGIRIGGNAHNARIGGSGSGEGNIVSGNSGFGISVFGTIGGHTIQGNSVGTNGAGNGVIGNANTGIWVPAPNNTIGGTTPGAGNVVAGNGVNGIQLSGATSVGNIVQGNWIGTDRTNTLSLGNIQIGIDIINGASNNVVGGPGGAANIITHNQTGVQIRTGSTGNALRNNAIVANSFLGLTINDGAFGNTIGGTGAGDGNLLQGNGKSIVVLGAPSVGNALLGNSIAGTLIGIDLVNDGVTPNDAGDADAGPNNLQNFPVLTSATVVGATLTVQGTLNSIASTTFRLEFFSTAACTAAGNGNGETFLGSLSATTDASGNASFTASLPAVPAGQSITATATDAGGNTSEFSACRAVPGQPQTFTVSNTNDSGPGSLRQAILDANARAGSLDSIAFNIPGTGVHTITLTAQLPSLQEPTIIDATTQPGFAGTPLIEVNGNGLNAHGLIILGGNSVVRGLIINRFGLNGIQITDHGGNVIEGNIIGTDAASTAGRGNFSGILMVDSTNNRVGGTTAAARNVISGNSNTGVVITGANTTGNVVQGNFIGTDVTGASALPNLGVQGGVFVTNGASGNTIGGNVVGAGNVVSGNAQHAITICCDNSTAGNIVQGNFVGTRSDAVTPLANGGIGIDIVGALNTTVGGVGAVAQNIISNNQTGIQIRTGATANTLRGNYIAGNTGIGVRVEDAAQNTIGGPAATDENVIQGNGTGIIVLGTSAGITITGNHIYGNPGLGIDLGDNGVTLNDAGDADTGPNNLQNFPVLTSVPGGVTGTINSTPNTTFRIEFFFSPTGDASGFGEGAFFLGATTVTTNAAGDAAIPFQAAPPGQVVTATATDPSGNTSEFSAAVTAAAAIRTWIRDGDGFWDEPTAWNDGVVPQAGETVVIDRPSGAFTITVRNPTNTIGSLTSTELLSIVDGGTLASAGSVALGNGLTQSGGSLTSGGVLALGGTSTWTGGQIQALEGIGVNTDATLTVNSPGAAGSLNSILVNAGAVVWNQASLQLTGAQILNLPTGVFEIQSNLSIAGAGAAITNQGILTKTGPGGALTLDGVLFVSTGILRLRLGAEPDRVTSNAACTIAGPLDVQLQSGFTPAPGTRFSVLECASLNGTFTTITGNGQTYTPEYTATGATLVAGSGPGSATPIALSAFSGAETVETFSPNFGRQNSPVTFNGITYADLNGGQLWSDINWQPNGYFTPFPNASGTTALSDTISLTNLRIDFSAPVNRVGIFAGPGPTTYTMTAYNDSLEAIGSTTQTSTEFKAVFLGLQAGVNIRRVVIIESNQGPSQVGIFEDLRYENWTSPEIVHQHAGSAAPGTEGFSSDGVATGTTVANDAGSGFGAWRILSASSTNGYYFAPLTAQQKIAAMTRGWKLTARMRVETGDTHANVDFAGFGPRFDIHLSRNASGDTVVGLATSIIPLVTTAYTLAGSGSSYHLYELVYDPTREVADLYVDGVLRLTDYAGTTQFQGDLGLIMGSGFFNGQNGLGFHILDRLEILP